MVVSRDAGRHRVTRSVLGLVARGEVESVGDAIDWRPTTSSSGAGAMGMAFTDALIDHADVHVTLVDRRHCGRRALAGRLSVRPAAPGVGVLRRRVDGAGDRRGAARAGRRPACRSGPVSRRSRRTTTTSSIDASSDPVASRSSEGATTTTDGSSHLVTSRVSGETVEVDVRRRVVDATYLSPTIPATTPPPFGVADDVRVVPVNELARLTAAPSELRHRRFRQDRDRRDRLAAGQRRGARPHRLGASTRSVDAQPRGGPARPGRGARRSRRTPWRRPIDARVARRPVPAPRGRRRDAADRPRRHPDDGQDADPRPTWELDLLRTIEHVVRLGHIRDVTRGEIVLDDGSIPLAPALARRPLRGLGTAVPAAGSALGARQDPTPDDPGRLPLLQRGAGRLRGGHPRRRPGAQPAVSAQHPAGQPGRLGARCRCAAPSRRARSAPSRTSPAWANGCALNPARIDPSRRDDPAVKAAAARLADHAERGLVRMAELAPEPLPTAEVG